MEKKQALNKKQLDFCKWYVETRNAKEAAIRAGFTMLPERTAMKLFAQSKVQKEIARLEEKEKAVEAEVVAGYRRLAFGSAADAIRLLQATETGEVLELDTLDLFLISEIKKSKTGGVEIKFFDRLKALEKLGTMQSSQNENAEPFYKALKASAMALAEGEAEA